MSSFLHYYKLKGFERDYIQILGFLNKKIVYVRLNPILTMFYPVKRWLVLPI